MAATHGELPRESAPSALLRQLELSPTAIAAVVLGWLVVWIVWAVTRVSPLAAASASACWLSLVVTAMAWRDLALLNRRWREGLYHSGRMLVPYHWWLAPPALALGILFGRMVW